MKPSMSRRRFNLKILFLFVFICGLNFFVFYSPRFAESAKNIRMPKFFPPSQLPKKPITANQNQFLFDNSQKVFLPEESISWTFKPSSNLFNDIKRSPADYNWTLGIQQSIDISKKSKSRKVPAVRFDWKHNALNRTYKYDLLNATQRRHDGRWGFGVGQKDERNIKFIKEMMAHAWKGYADFAFGSDQLCPVSKQGKDWLGGNHGLGATIIDSLSTLMLMNMTDEWKEAANWVQELNFNQNSFFDTFETNIRVVGGLLSAYDYTSDPMFLKKGREVASKLLRAFNSKSGFPYPRINFQTGDVQETWSVNLAQLGTNIVEFLYLTLQTDDSQYQKTSERVFEYLFNKTQAESPIPGLYPLFYTVDSGYSGTDYFSLGAMGDSFYEYMLKGWLLGGRKDTKLRMEYDRSVDAILSYLTTPMKDLIYIAKGNPHFVNKELEHLTCFAGGMLALGAVSKTTEYSNRVFELADQFTEACYKLYSSQSIFLSPDVVHMPSYAPQPGAEHYIQRPEVLESIFYMWRLTHDIKYRHWAENIANAIFKHTFVSTGGFTGLQSVVTNAKDSIPRPNDSQESFFLAETLKYLYLIFEDDDVLPLEGVVFNTEAHPVRIKS